MPTPDRITACVIILNEAGRVGVCLTSFASCEEVVVDSGFAGGACTLAAAVGYRCARRTECPGDLLHLRIACPDRVLWLFYRLVGVGMLIDEDARAQGGGLGWQTQTVLEELWMTMVEADLGELSVAPCTDRFRGLLTATMGSPVATELIATCCKVSGLPRDTEQRRRYLARRTAGSRRGKEDGRQGARQSYLLPSHDFPLVQ